MRRVITGQVGFTKTREAKVENVSKRRTTDEATPQVSSGRTIVGQVDLPTKGQRTDLYPERRKAVRKPSSLSRNDYHAAIRYHILKGLATGTYRTHRMAAEALGVSEVWVGRVVS